MIIEARHNKAAQYIFRAYLNNLLRKNFTNFFLTNFPPEPPREMSVAITPNHISWWDGFFIYELNHRMMMRNFFIMMLQEELEKNWFFKYVGAYSIKPENPVSVSKTLKYTQKLLSNPSNTIVLYPQGEIEDFDRKPLSLNRGLQTFLKNSNDKCVVLPFAFKVQYYNKKHPAIACRAGEYIDASDIVNNFDLYKKAFSSNIDALKEAAFSRNFVHDLFEKE